METIEIKIYVCDSTWFEREKTETEFKIEKSAFFVISTYVYIKNSKCMTVQIAPPPPPLYISNPKISIDWGAKRGGTRRHILNVILK